MGMLDGKIAIVTGASSGIGASVAELMVGEGARVAAAARRADRLEDLAKKCGDALLPVTTDVRLEKDILNLWDACEKKFGVPHIVVNCAGYAQHKATDELSLDEWNDIMATNLTSAFLMSRETLRRMKPLKRGKIINVGSISSKMPRPMTIGYAASKSGMQGLTHSLAMDAREDGITCSIIHPGSTVSELSPNMADRPRWDTMATEDISRTILHMAALPDETNLFEALMLPIRQPYLGRS